MEFVQAQGCSPRSHPSGQPGSTVTSLNLLQTEIKFIFGDLSENGCNRDKKYAAGGWSMNMQRLTHPIERESIIIPRKLESMRYEKENSGVSALWIILLIQQVFCALC